MAEHLAAGLENVADHRRRHGAVGHLDRRLDHRQREALDAVAIDAKVPLLGLEQFFGEAVDLDMAGKKRRETLLRQPIEMLVLPERVVGVEADRGKG